jgi:phosphatidylethanolamine-binding protein (PEBP) family uncharacterized protein
MKVTYNGVIVNSNNKYLSPNTAKNKPKIELLNTDSNKYYTLIMHDPDAPVGNYVHWVIANIPGKNLNAGDTILSYKGPVPPPPASLTHHYIFLLYEQPDKLSLPITVSNVTEMSKLLNLLKLSKSNERESFTFTSHYDGVGGKGKRKNKSKKRKSLNYRRNTHRVHKSV